MLMDHWRNYNGQELYEEILDCRRLLSSQANMKTSRPEELAKLVVYAGERVQYGDEGIFPNLCIAIQVVLTTVEILK